MAAPQTVTKSAYDHNGNAWADLTSTGTLITRRIYGNVTDALIARIDSSGVAWYLTDNLGSVRDITNSSGSIIDHRDYDAFGNMTYESAPTYGDRYGFTGREFDTITGLQYNRAGGTARRPVGGRTKIQRDLVPATAIYTGMCLILQQTILILRG